MRQRPPHTPPPLRVVGDVGGGWEGARRRWETHALLPMERVVALVAVGQLMRLGLDATGLWGFIRRLIPWGGERGRPDAGSGGGEEPPHTVNDNLDGDEPILFFHIVDRGVAGAPLIVPRKPLLLFASQLGNI